MKDLDKRNVISMSEFIMNYLHVDNLEEVLNKVNHYDITDLNIKGVKRVPNDLVTADDIQTGRVLLVESSGFKHHGKMICAYIRPDLVNEEEENNLSDLDKMIYNSLYKADTPLFLNKSLKRVKKQF